MGFSIIEILIAGALIGFIAIAILPAMFSIMDQTKATGFKAECAAIVRAKLAEYVNGVATDTTLVPNGYEYTKRRYQANQSSCQIDPIDAGSPGYRERVISNEIIPDNAIQDASDSLRGPLRGFQLYVMIRHYNPRVLANQQPVRACPAANYQFLRVGDAFEVTVTGMIRVQPPVANSGRGGVKYGELDDLDANTPNPLLTCSASQVIYPPNIPFRYYLGVDGKLRSMMARYTIPDAGDPDLLMKAMESHYRSIWSTQADGNLDSPPVGNVQALVAAPDNRSVYTLKPGVITLYHDCNDSYTRSINSTPFTGVPDCSLEEEDKLVWTSEANANIGSIAVDFKQLEDGLGNVYHQDDVIYGLFNSGSDTGGTLRQFDKATNLWKDPTGGVATVPDIPRVRGIFLSQTFPALSNTEAPNLYVIDNTCYNQDGALLNSSSASWVYCVTVFNAADANASLDVKELPVQVQAVSY